LGAWKTVIYAPNNLATANPTVIFLKRYGISSKQTSMTLWLYVLKERFPREVADMKTVYVITTGNIQVHLS
jgi:hypothetical protein